MKEFKGTPGPWIVGFVNSNDDIWIMNDDSSSVAIAESKTGDGYLWSPDTVVKNANLIAAAPELLEALQIILDPVTTYLPSTSEESKKAWAAINKALGEK